MSTPPSDPATGRRDYERGADEIAAALAQARAALQTLRTAPPQADPQDPPQGVGEAVNGLVRAVIERGRLASLIIDPRVLRLPSEEVAEGVTAAVNQALEAWDAESTPAGAAGPDAEALDAQLAQLQESSVRQMQQYTQAITDIMARFGQAGRR